jgi:phosphatidylserine decarboxylase
MASNRTGLIVREGFRFILPLALLPAAFALLKMPKTASVAFLAALFNIWFFRNPERTAPADEKAVVSPADGKVIKVEEAEEVDGIAGRFRRISIFMSVLNVHVNRIPFAGRVESIRYRKGEFRFAHVDKASSLNERNLIRLRTDEGKEIVFVQIAGILARRIVCWITEGAAVRKGERFGLICYGSRLDIYLPPESEIAVQTGEAVTAGETILGYLR